MVKRFDTGELGREGIVLCGEFVLASDYDTLESRIRELEAKLRLTEGAFKNTRIRELEAAIDKTLRTGLLQHIREVASQSATSDADSPKPER